jgi:hypothetical protein
MKWTFVDSCGPGIVSRPQANGRVAGAFNKLQDGSYGLSQLARSRTGHQSRTATVRKAAASITSEDQ